MICILGQIRNPIGYSPEHPAVGEPTLNSSIELDNLQKCFPNPTTLSFCASAYVVYTKERLNSTEVN